MFACLSKRLRNASWMLISFMTNLSEQWVFISILFLTGQGWLIHENPERPPDGPLRCACLSPAHDPPSHHELHLLCSIAVEHDDPRAQGLRQKPAEKTASGKAPVAGTQDMGGNMVRLPDSTDKRAEQTPRDAARDRNHPASALHGNGAADDILLTQFPGIPVRVCIALRPDASRPRQDNTVNDAILLLRRGEYDHISLLQIFDTAVGKNNPVSWPEERAHAVATAEEVSLRSFLKPAGPAFLHHRFSIPHLPAQW
jgi:hypothetical protein